MPPATRSTAEFPTSCTSIVAELHAVVYSRQKSGSTEVDPAVFINKHKQGQLEQAGSGACLYTVDILDRIPYSILLHSRRLRHSNIVELSAWQGMEQEVAELITDEYLQQIGIPHRPGGVESLLDEHQMGQLFLASSLARTEYPEPERRLEYRALALDVLGRMSGFSRDLLDQLGRIAWNGLEPSKMARRV